MKQFLLALAILLPLNAMAQRPDIRRNQVGNYPQQEKVVVVEGTNAVNKLRITTPSGKVLEAKGVRKAVSPLSQKTRYVVNLGRNATGYCFVTGFGDKSPMHPHHRPSEADGIQAPYPGMLVGGPNPGQQDKKSLGAVVYPSNVPDESYIDTTESYASNEIAINWNASLVAFLCWLEALSGQLTVQ